MVRDGEIQDLSSTTQRNLVPLSRNSTAADTGTATVETDLMTYTLPADYMGKTGVLHIKASGVISGGVGNKTLTFYFGATAHVLHASANDTGDWSSDIYIHQAGNRASQRLDINHLYGTTVAINDGITDGVNTTGTVIIKFTGLTADGADLVEQRTMLIVGQ